ncbi:hypothetical protein BsWGS_14232 [Bradybaena similaris]
MAYVHTDVMVLLLVSSYCLAEDFDPPIITYPNGSHNLYYRSGDRVRIKCTAEGKPPPTYRWLENDVEIKSSPEIHYNETTGALEITSFSLRHQTSYRCVASNQHEVDANQRVTVSTMSKKIRLWQLRLEKFATADVTKDVVEYDYLVLPCGDRKASVTPALRYTWYNAGDHTSVGMASGRLYIDLEGSLHFTYVLLGDGRIPGYSCGISAKLSDVPLIRLGTKFIVKVSPATTAPAETKPQFRYSNNVVFAMKDSAATLECMFSGYGTRLYPIQTWVDVNGTAQYVDSSKYKISADGRQMTVYNVQEDDERFYFCWASYGPGLHASFAVFLNVTSPPFFSTSPPTDQTGIQNSSAQFICDTRSVRDEVPPSPPDWSINGKRMMNTYDRDKFQLSNDSKVLTVKNLRKHRDVMCVQCEVYNSVGAALASACLNVIMEIQILTRPQAVQDIEYGGIIDLTVKASTDPTVNLSYRWYSPTVTFDESSIPEYVSYNPQSHEALIDTSRLSLGDYNLTAGMYNINVFHQYESRIFGTEVKLTWTPMSTTTTGMW